MLNQVAAALKTAMAERSIESLEAAIPKAEAYSIDTKAAKKLLKELLKVRKTFWRPLYKVVFVVAKAITDTTLMIPIVKTRRLNTLCAQPGGGGAQGGAQGAEEHPVARGRDP